MKLTYTELRHAMLQAIADGHVLPGLGVGGSFAYQMAKLPSSYGWCTRAMFTLISAGLCFTPFNASYSTPLELTGAGRKVLESWDVGTKAHATTKEEEKPDA